ncbi:helix-turn-helix domain-containing protein [Microbacterium sp. KSW2-21]|uniref:Helix-turn-helix domain-containing protein n=1 Tax=Microbacterium algihabitans TaxID=3075992 RepID=A0ABU3S047_9MICO|nr:helix-turn-helix domain-containing protein [Microbacterium sp. KSW2-21]MDU0328513.1 helix-turn-helix domain-containing protein [Microbacterium sp. KSW2-21]
MNPPSPTPAPAPDLRERRRRELARTIAATAVELFERNGFAATTIDDIAGAAGISRTTFFRHCASKEAAVLVDDAGLESELIDAAQQVSAARPLRDLETEWESMTEVFDADPEGRDRFLRVRRLMRDNAPLLAAGLERDARLTEQIATALSSRPVSDALDARAVAESFALGMRLTFDEWVRRADHGPTSAPPPLNEVYQQVRAAIGRANGGSTR